MEKIQRDRKVSDGKTRKKNSKFFCSVQKCDAEKKEEEEDEIITEIKYVEVERSECNDDDDEKYRRKKKEKTKKKKKKQIAKFMAFNAWNIFMCHNSELAQSIYRVAQRHVFAYVRCSSSYEWELHFYLCDFGDRRKTTTHHRSRATPPPPSTTIVEMESGTENGNSSSGPVVDVVVVVVDEHP